MNVLCLDIGSGTQDVLFSLEGESPENWPKFVLPSPPRRVARRIRALTAQERPIYLHGGNMGGGFKGALMEHLRMGGHVAAHPEAATALSDSEDKVRGMGVALCEARPEGYVPVGLADFEPGFWDAFLTMLDLPAPDLVLAAVQDHGFHPESSNRLGRFSIWQRLLRESEGRPEAFLFREPPSELTRLRSLHRAVGQGVVADTGTAAVLGALSVPEVERASREGGACVVNVGNSHVIAFLLLDGSIRGIYEHHTGLMDEQSLWRDLELFRSGGLGGDEVFRNEGHGCCYLDEPEKVGDFGSVYVLGPNRDMLAGYPVTFPAPGGDMMLAGCFGLLHGLKRLQES